MGVKSTITLTEGEALDLYLSLKLSDETLQRALKARALLMTTEELENELERLDDEQHDGESCRNYSISYEIPFERY